MPTTTGPATLPRETYRNLIRVHERLTGELAALLRKHGASTAQYNVMRVLHGAPTGGAPCQYIGANLLTKVPDVTRLIDRMVAADLVRRERSKKDRRIVLVNLTSKGREIFHKLKGPVEELHDGQLAHLDDGQINALNETLLGMLHQATPEADAGQERSGPKES
ncbi:MAG: MarR family transcriptional regulator [Planctomycetota bacterium]|nr:MarR family transcriptional regulator [Planctomycetota bacterium]